MLRVATRERSQINMTKSDQKLESQQELDALEQNSMHPTSENMNR